MTISMNLQNKKKARSGIALLVVLFIVMAITILSLGFMSKSNVELACGQNMVLRTRLDYLAESGLEHAKGLVLNPQDVNPPDKYWKGAVSQQLVAGSSYYYDLVVVRDDTDPTDRCNYIIDCNSYWIQGPGNISRSNLRAILRLDPCIALWIGSNTTIWSQTTIHGDVYCGGNLTNNSSNIDGDAFAVGTISGTFTGQKNNTVTNGYPVAWPGLVSTNFSSIYYIGSNSYNVDKPTDPNMLVDPFSASGANRAKIWYCAGNANMPGGATINGTLVVTGDLTVSGASNIITAEPNFPALIVDGQVVMKDNSSLVINGLAQIGQQITDDPNTTSATINVTGGLFINSNGINSNVISVNVTADPAIASIEVWSAINTSIRWRPAGGAFFRSIERK